jgi:FMN phosphatase YigB (HAD superfamily)
VAGLRTDYGLCWDLGDVIFSEETEIFNAGGVTERVVLVPGIGELLRSLAARAIPMAVVSDTRIGACENVLGPHGLEGCFVHRTISEALGVEKPHRSMFESASVALGLPFERLAMIGNHYRRDIEGAGAVGMATIWFHWNDRYASPAATPAADYIATDVQSLSGAIERWIARLGEVLSGASA